MSRLGFYYEKNLLGNVGKVVEPYVIKNSQTISVGDAVKADPSDGIEIASNAAAILGVVNGFEDGDGRPGERSDDITYTSTTVPHEFVADSDNETVDEVKAQVILTPFAIYSNEPDATIGTTTGSDQPFYFSDIVSASNQVDESAAHETTAQQMIIMGTQTSEDGQKTYGLYLIYESQIKLVAS